MKISYRHQSTMEDGEAEHSFSERDEDVDVNAGDDAEEKEKKV